MDNTIGGYYLVPEATLYDEVMGHRGFLDRKVLADRLKGIKDDLNTYTRFLEAGCRHPSSEGFDGEPITNGPVLDTWDMIRQYCHVYEGAIAFIDSPVGEKLVHYEQLRQEARYLNKTLDDIEETSSPTNVSGLLSAIRETEEEMERIDAGSRQEMWLYNEAPPGKELMNYEVGLAWRAIMKGMGRKSAAVLRG
jgi:hypothetical protein